MTEGQASVAPLGPVGHQRGLAQAPQGLERRPLAPLAQRGQEPGVEALTEQRGPAQELTVARAERAHPAQQHLLDRPRKGDRPVQGPATREPDRACPRPRRHAPAPRPRRGCRRWRAPPCARSAPSSSAPRMSRSIRATSSAPQRRQAHLLAQALAGQLVAQRVQAGAGRRLVRAVGQGEQDRRVPGGPRQVGDQGMAGGDRPSAGPRARAPGRPGRRGPAGSGRRPRTGRRGPARARARPRRARAGAGRGTPPPAGRRAPGRRATSGAPRAGRPGARRAAARPRAGWLGPPGPGDRAPGPGPQGRREPGLAQPRLAGDGDDLSRAGAGLQQPVQALQDPLAPDDAPRQQGARRRTPAHDRFTAPPRADRRRMCASSGRGQALPSSRADQGREKSGRHEVVARRRPGEGAARPRADRGAESGADALLNPAVVGWAI